MAQKISANIRRGLWRLWIASTALWVLIAGPILWNVGNMDRYVNRITSDEMVWKYVEKEPPPPDQSKTKSRGRIDLEGSVLLTPEEAKQYFSSTHPSTYDEKYRKAPDPEGQKRRIRDAWIQVSSFVAVIIGLPLAILALVFIGAWIIRGFRQETV